MSLPSAETAIAYLLRALGVPKSELENPMLDLVNTPRRMVRMLRDEMLASYKPGTDLRAICTKFPSDGKDAMVLVRGISFTSLCSHHALSFSGVAHVAYIPGPWLLGASKLPRIVEHYSKMFQIQERLTRQVADFLYEEAEAKLVIVLTRATHECMRCRGVRQPSSEMIVTAVRPEPDSGNSEWRGVVDEFYAQIGMK